MDFQIKAYIFMLISASLLAGYYLKEYILIFWIITFVHFICFTTIKFITGFFMKQHYYDTIALAVLFWSMFLSMFIIMWLTSNITAINSPSIILFLSMMISSIVFYFYCFVFHKKFYISNIIQFIISWFILIPIVTFMYIMAMSNY